MFWGYINAVADRHFANIILQIEHIDHKLDRMVGILNLVLQQEKAMAIDLTKVTAEVARNKTVTDSVLALLTQLAAIIAAIPPSTDPVTQAALDDLTTALVTEDDALAAAVVTGTPKVS